MPSKYELLDIAKDQSIYSELWYFTKFEFETYFLLDMNAKYQCLFEIKPQGNNKADVELTNYSNCKLAPFTFEDVEVNSEDLSLIGPDGEEYYLVSEF